MLTRNTPFGQNHTPAQCTPSQRMPAETRHVRVSLGARKCGIQNEIEIASVHPTIHCRLQSIFLYQVQCAETSAARCPPATMIVTFEEHHKKGLPNRTHDTWCMTTEANMPRPSYVIGRNTNRHPILDGQDDSTHPWSTPSDMIANATLHTPTYRGPFGQKSATPSVGPKRRFW